MTIYIFNIIMCDHTRVIAVHAEDKCEAENIAMVSYPDYTIDYQGTLEFGVADVIKEIAYIKA